MIQLNNRSECLANLEELIKTAADPSDGYRLRAWVYTSYDEEHPQEPPLSEETMRANFEEAILGLEEILKRHPNDVGSHRLRGTLYFKIGKHKEAILDIDQCIKSSPNDIILYMQKAEILLVQDQYDDVIQTC